MPRSVTLASPAPKRTPWYFLTELIFFVIPLFALLLDQWKKMDRAAFIKAVLVVAVLAYPWSFLVSWQGWWTFSAANLLGWNLIPHLPVEEVLFYPLGGSLCILLYSFFSERFGSVKPLGAWSWVGPAVASLGTLAALGVSFFILHQKPYYVLSQVLLFNALALALWHRARGGLAWLPLVATVLLMTLIGFTWNWLAFSLGWWQYHAVLGWYFPSAVPVDDWNFYFFAPLAAIELYAGFRRAGTLP